MCRALFSCNTRYKIEICLFALLPMIYGRYLKKTTLMIWDKVFKSGFSKSFKGFLPQNLLSPLLNTLSHFWLVSTFCTTEKHKEVFGVKGRGYRKET